MSVLPANGGGGYGSYIGDRCSVAPRTKYTKSLFSFTLSSKRFCYGEASEEEEETVDCINKSGHLFAEFKEKPPTLEEALRYMEYSETKAKELSGSFLKRAKEKLDEELEAPKLIPKDIAVILCYTFEWDKKRFGEGIESPYRKLNNSLSTDRSNASLKKTRGFLFLLLQALRKLPRYTPVKGVLYRGIKVKVQIESNQESPKAKPYAAGNEKTWWTFTSTTEDLEATKTFIGESDGTLFTVTGKPWGYDISMFSDFPDEKEILLEPERVLKATSVIRDKNIIAVNAEMMKTPLVLDDIIKVKAVKINEKLSKIKEVPRNLRAENITESVVELSWLPPVVRTDKILSYQISVRKTEDSSRFFNRNPERTLTTQETGCAVDNLAMGEEYEFRVRCKFRDGWGTWGEKIEVRVGFSMCVWKEYPDDVDGKRKCFVDKKNPRTASKTWDGFCSTIVGTIPLPLNEAVSWSIKVVKSRNNDGGSIYIGAAPSDIDQNEGKNHENYGWYLCCYDSTLWSGPPHNYRGKGYSTWKEWDGEYVHTGDNVGVLMDTIKGELSFALNGVNYGVAYKWISLDKPLVPCVILINGGDSVELDTSEVKENVDSSIPVPSNIITRNNSWDSLTLKWDEVEGATFYQIGVDENDSWGASTGNTFTKRGLLPGTEYSFRVRAVSGNSVSGWSNVAKGKTQKAPDFSSCVWKQCPDNVEMRRKYVVNGNDPRIATNINDNFCTVTGNAPLPLNTMVSWNIRILNSSMNNGYNIYVGVAPFGLDQNGKNNHETCGWYLSCWDSKLYSGLPQGYRGKEYVSINRWDGQYVHTGDTIGVSMNTVTGVISFSLNGMNLGVAFEGIPLDKPLVPCVVLYYPGDSVGIII